MPAVEIKDRVMSCTRCYIVVASRTVIDFIIMFPSSGTLAMCQGTIIPRQLRKHGCGSYPLDISGETVPTS